MRPTYYWDPSAIVPTLVSSLRTREARRWLRTGTHVLSSLAYAEVCAALGRGKRVGELTADRFYAAHAKLDQPIWRRSGLLPARSIVRELSERVALAGAELWHLAFAKTLQRDVPELIFLTYDDVLGRAAAGEGLRSAP